MSASTLLVGRGVADITGEPWGAGMMGYGMPDQRTNGILTRQYARAYVFDDGERRIAYVVADIAMFFQATTAGVLERLSALFGDRFGDHNVVLTATHTHCGPGGHGHHVLYNITTRDSTVVPTSGSSMASSRRSSGPPTISRTRCSSSTVAS